MKNLQRCYCIVLLIFCNTLVFCKNSIKLRISGFIEQGGILVLKHTPKSPLFRRDFLSPL
ncbi:hypothetical protein KsCSTR_31510 [Candidatus Kuenenia stuttgartiensis]|uniref:Uncharacterized protein n=1 Tax=Kuenenia stuttgartiensis TaxID=174633 RepID=Q1Q4X6_KUEST|nr:hypothetical protein KsCSTR_31510 [Candidatus Kuenenia stuttgartiensis]CAJ75072.1 unknown protein [Candidatus Kuenenia stuttgartiensis]